MNDRVRITQSLTFRKAIAGPVLAAAVAIAFTSVRPPQAPLEATTRPRFKAVAFDAFVLFNPDSVVSDVERMLPGKGRQLVDVWRTRQFECTWLRSITNHYADFFAVTDDALEYAARVVNVQLTHKQKQILLDAYMHLAPWPDTRAGLQRLRAAGIRVIALANFTPAMLRANAQHAHLTGLFEALVSTDESHIFKPDPRAYRLGIDRLHAAKEEVVFAAFGGWDAAGAKLFGYPTVWVNRFNQPGEQLGVQPDYVATNLSGVLEFVLNTPTAR